MFAIFQGGGGGGSGPPVLPLDPCMGSCRMDIPVFKTNVSNNSFRKLINVSKRLDQDHALDVLSS